MGSLVFFVFAWSAHYCFTNPIFVIPRMSKDLTRKADCEREENQCPRLFVSAQDETRKAQDVDDNDEDASGLADVVGQGHDEHDEELSGMEDLPEEGEQEEGEQDDGEVYDGEEGHHSYAQWEKEYDERWPLEIHLSQAYLDAQAASHGVTDDQRADLKDWTHSCAM